MENTDLIFDDCLLIVEEYKGLEVINSDTDRGEENIETETIDDWIDLE